jgi:hypothetical protein
MIIRVVLSWVKLKPLKYSLISIFVAKLKVALSP